MWNGGEARLEATSFVEYGRNTIGWEERLERGDVLVLKLLNPTEFDGSQ